MNPQTLFRQKALEKLQSPDRLDELMTVTAPAGWLALLVAGALLGAALAWATLGSVQIRLASDGALVGGPAAPLEAVLFVSAADGQRVRPGMAAQLSPIGVRPEEHGLLLGRVRSVRAAPASLAEMADVAGSDALAQSWAAAGRLIEVRVALEPAASDAGGYRWSLGAGPPSPLQAGTPLVGSILLEERRPISLIAP